MPFLLNVGKTKVQMRHKFVAEKTQICCYHHKPQQKWSPLEHDGQFNITATFFVEDDVWMMCFRR